LSFFSRLFRRGTALQTKPIRAYIRDMSTSTRLQSRQLGADGPSVFPIALGCMGMSGMYGPADEAESIATIHAALDHGITLLDTGAFYGAVWSPSFGALPKKEASARRSSPSRGCSRGGKTSSRSSAPGRARSWPSLWARCRCLSPEDLAVAGTRYDDRQMRMLDSER
jgi:hypothetical protein